MFTKDYMSQIKNTSVWTDIKENTMEDKIVRIFEEIGI